ncbi:MAG: GPR endopeptidase, partial [Oscillospiraceae bacterium]
REVSALSPGAMGQTGLEAAEIIRAVVKAFPFRAVVAVDALAARSMQRLGMTVQLADSGIAPGAGVMNRRVELSQRTLGLPVVSLGIPTVVDAATLLADFAPACDANEAASGLIVTPRDIDRIISDGARLLARGLNRALQPSLSPADIDLLMS